MELPPVFSRAGRRATLIPVDPYYLVHRAEELGYHPQVILAGRAINDSMPAHVAGMMIRGLNEAGKVIKGSKVLIMGLAYKENVADIRESPARGIVERFFHKKSSKNCPSGGILCLSRRRLRGLV